MKPFYLVLLFGLSVTFIISCNNKKADSKQQEGKAGNRNRIVVNYVGVVPTRKTYSDIQFIKNKKERDAYLKKQEASKPLVYDALDSISSFLVTRFEILGIIKKGELLLQKFKSQSDEKTIYVDSSGKRISLSFFPNQLTGQYHFKLLFATDSVDVNTGATTLQNLDYAFLDVIPGGNKELVFLNDYYIMNGDNFDFMVYEIKIH